MTLKQALLAATVLALPLAAAGTAQAQQPVTGIYVGAGAGANFRQDPEVSTVRRDISLGSFETKDVGFVGLGSIGYGFGNGLRAEIEGNYRFNEVDGGGSGVRTSGYLRTYGAMANVFYDFVGLGIPVVPYLGLGAGAAINDFDDVISSVAGPNPGQTTRLGLSGNRWEFAYQAIAGVAYALDSVVPGLALTAEYRFFGTLDSEARASIVTRNANNSVAAAGVTRVDVDNYNHSVLLGVRYNFGRVAPAPVVAPQPAAPAPGIARTYLVFFDWDRADLTERARQIIAEAAGNSTRVGSTRIEVSGHADRSGTPQYNQALSQRRANVVAAELVRLGVARTAITIQAFGESRPLVPTADGVREPQNRRVEIVLR